MQRSSSPAPSATTAANPAAPPPDGEPKSTKRRNWPVWIAGVCGLVVGFSGGMAIGGGSPSSAASGSSEQAASLSTVLAECELDEESTWGVNLMDDGQSLAFNATETGVLAIEVADAACILTTSGAPESVIARISQTRALDGTQTANWSGYDVSWTYHPDDGLNVVMVGESDD